MNSRLQNYRNTSKTLSSWIKKVHVALKTINCMIGGLLLIILNNEHSLKFWGCTLDYLEFFLWFFNMSSKHHNFFLPMFFKISKKKGTYVYIHNNFLSLSFCCFQGIYLQFWCGKTSSLVVLRSPNFLERIF